MKIYQIKTEEILYMKRSLQQIFQGIDYDGLTLLHDIINRKLYECFISTNNGIIYIELENYVGNNKYFIMKISNILSNNVFLEIDHLDDETVSKLFDWIEDYMEE